MTAKLSVPCQFAFWKKQKKSISLQSLVTRWVLFVEGIIVLIERKYKKVVLFQP